MNPSRLFIDRKYGKALIGAALKKLHPDAGNDSVVCNLFSEGDQPVGPVTDVFFQLTGDKEIKERFEALEREEKLEAE